VFFIYSPGRFLFNKVLEVSHAALEAFPWAFPVNDWALSARAAICPGSWGRGATAHAPGDAPPLRVRGSPATSWGRKRGSPQPLLPRGALDSGGVAG
jgi:hypothetical protein